MALAEEEQGQEGQDGAEDGAREEAGDDGFAGECGTGLWFWGGGGVEGWEGG